MLTYDGPKAMYASQIEVLLEHFGIKDSDSRKHYANTIGMMFIVQFSKSWLISIMLRIISLSISFVVSVIIFFIGWHVISSVVISMSVVPLSTRLFALAIIILLLCFL